MISTQVLLEPLPVLANLPATRLYVAAKTFTTSNLWDVFFSAEINQCVGPALRYYLLFWPPRRSARVLGALARGVLGLLTRTFDFRTGALPRAARARRRLGREFRGGARRVPYQSASRVARDPAPGRVANEGRALPGVPVRGDAPAERGPPRLRVLPTHRARPLRVVARARRRGSRRPRTVVRRNLRPHLRRRRPLPACELDADD